MDLSEYPPVETYIHLEISTTATPFEDVWGRKRKYQYGRNREGLSKNFHAFFGELHDNTFIRRYGPAYGTASMLADEADNSKSVVDAESLNFDDTCHEETEDKTKHFASEDKWNEFIYNCTGTVSFLTPKNQNANPSKLNLVNVESSAVRCQKLKWRRICQQKKRDKREEEKRKSLLQSEDNTPEKNYKLSDNGTSTDKRSNQDSISHSMNKQKSNTSLKDILSKVDFKNTKSTIFESYKRFYEDAEFRKLASKTEDSSGTHLYKERKRTSNYNQKFQNTTKIFDKHQQKENIEIIFSGGSTYMSSNIEESKEDFSTNSTYPSSNKDNKTSEYCSNYYGNKLNKHSDINIVELNKHESKENIEEFPKKNIHSSNIIYDSEIHEYRERRHSNNYIEKKKNAGTNTGFINEQENKEETKKFSRKSVYPFCTVDDYEEAHEYHNKNIGTNTDHVETNTIPLKKHVNQDTNEDFSRKRSYSHFDSEDNETFRYSESRQYNNKNATTNTTPVYKFEHRGKSEDYYGKKTYPSSKFISEDNTKSRRLNNNISKFRNAATNTTPFNVYGHQEEIIEDFTRSRAYPSSKLISENNKTYKYTENRRLNNNISKFKNAATNTTPFNIHGHQEENIEDFTRSTRSRPSNIEYEYNIYGDKVRKPLNKYEGKFKDAGNNAESTRSRAYTPSNIEYEYNIYGDKVRKPLNKYEGKFKDAGNNTESTRSRAYTASNIEYEYNIYGDKVRKPLNKYEGKFKDAGNNTESTRSRAYTASNIEYEYNIYGDKVRKPLNKYEGKFKDAGNNTESTRSRAYPPSNIEYEYNIYGHKVRKPLNKYEGRFKDAGNNTESSNKHRNTMKSYQSSTVFEDQKTYRFKERRQSNDFRSNLNEHEENDDFSRNISSNLDCANNETYVHRENRHFNDYQKKYNKEHENKTRNTDFSKGKSSSSNVVCRIRDKEPYGYRERSSSIDCQFKNAAINTNPVNMHENKEAYTDIFSRQNTSPSSIADEVRDNDVKTIFVSDSLILSRRGALSAKIRSLTNKQTRFSQPMGEFQGTNGEKITRYKTRQAARSGRSWGARSCNDDLDCQVPFIVSSTENWDVEENLDLATNIISHEDNCNNNEDHQIPSLVGINKNCDDVEENSGLAASITYSQENKQNMFTDSLKIGSSLTTVEDIDTLKEALTSGKYSTSLNFLKIQSDCLDSSIIPTYEGNLRNYEETSKSTRIEDLPKEKFDYEQGFENIKTELKSKDTEMPTKDVKQNYKFLETFNKHAISRRYIRGRRVWNGTEYTEDESSYRPFIESVLAKCEGKVEEMKPDEERNAEELRKGIANINLETGNKGAIISGNEEAQLPTLRRPSSRGQIRGRRILNCAPLV